MILSNHDHENLKKYKTNNKILNGVHYTMFYKILSSLNFNPISINDINNIITTSDSHIIGKLPSGGNPKTNVLVQFYFNNGNKTFITISCKKTNSRSISVHQYSARSFSKVLDI